MLLFYMKTMENHRFLTFPVKEFLDIQATAKCRFTQKRILNMITHS